MSKDEPIVFIVDDDELICRALAKLLRSVKLNVETFSTAGEFLSRLPVDCPCCLLLDVRLPEVSGLELQDRLAAMDADIPIIFITGHGTISMSVRAIKAGAVDFIQKPFDEQELIDKIQKALDQSRELNEKSRMLNELRIRAESLTDREREVFALVTRGLMNKEIAFELGTSEKTIKTHRAQVMKKMKVDSLADLVLTADKLGLTENNC